MTKSIPARVYGSCKFLVKVPPKPPPECFLPNRLCSLPSWIAVDFQVIHQKVSRAEYTPSLIARLHLGVRSYNDPSFLALGQIHRVPHTRLTHRREDAIAALPASMLLWRLSRFLEPD
jgi:hypothetical protein